MTRSGQSGWAGRGGFGSFRFGVHCLLQHARARIEVALVPPHEIAIQLLPDQFPPWEGHAFLAAQVADEFADQPAQIDRTRVWGLSFLLLVIPIVAAFFSVAASGRSRPPATPARTFPSGRR